MAINASGIRDTARVLKINKNTVGSGLKLLFLFLSLLEKTHTSLVISGVYVSSELYKHKQNHSFDPLP